MSYLPSYRHDMQLWALFALWQYLKFTPKRCKYLAEFKCLTKGVTVHFSNLNRNSKKHHEKHSRCQVHIWVTVQGFCADSSHRCQKNPITIMNLSLLRLLTLGAVLHCPQFHYLNRTSGLILPSPCLPPLNICSRHNDHIYAVCAQTCSFQGSLHNQWK